MKRTWPRPRRLQIEIGKHAYVDIGYMTVEEMQYLIEQLKQEIDQRIQEEVVAET